MPRKVKPFPQVLFTQSLSTGRLIKPRYIVSDFLDEDVQPVIIMVPQDDRPVRKMLSGNELLNAAKTKKIAAQLDMLKALNIVHDDRPKPPPEPKAPEIKGQRAIAKLGNKFVIMFKSDPIRRW